MGAGTCSPAMIGHRGCMLTVRCWIMPDGDIPWVEVNQREYHRNFVMPSTLHEKVSLIWHQIPIARQRIGMTSSCMIPRYLDTLRWPTGSAVECTTTVESTNDSVMNDAWDTVRLNG